MWYFIIFTDCGVGAPVHGREFIDGLNDIEKCLSPC